MVMHKMQNGPSTARLPCRTLQVSHPMVYAVYEKLPTVGPLVQQPDGQYVYGAPGTAPPLQGSVARV